MGKDIPPPEYAHVKILSIDTPEAEKCAGVAKVVTGRNINFRYGDNMKDRIALAIDRVRYIGEPVVAVVADSVYRARQSEEEIIDTLSHHPCRCTGYEAIFESAKLAQRKLSAAVKEAS